MKVIQLLNKIANGEIEDKTKFRIYFANNMYRDIYYDDEEQNQLNCLKNVSDDYSIYDDICLLDEVEIIEDTQEEKKIPEKWNDLSFTTMRKREEGIDDDIQKLKGYIETIMRTQNEVIDYLKNKGDE